MNKTALIDSSSAILLFKCGLWDIFLAEFNPITSTSVMHELSASGYTGADVFAETLAEKNISPENLCAEKSIQQYPSLVKLDQGERDLMLLYLQGVGDYIVLDDGAGVSFCRSAGIHHMNALLVPSVLFFSGMITEDEKNSRVKSLINTGRYSDFVKNFAENCSPQQLNYFLL